MSLMTKFFWNASRSTFLGTTPSKKRALQPKHPHKVCINKKFVAVGTLSNFPAPISLFLNLWSRRTNEGQAFQIPWGVLCQCGYTSGGKVALINWQQCRVRSFFRFALLCPITLELQNSRVRLHKLFRKHSFLCAIHTKVLQELDHSYCKGVGHQK